MNTQTVRFLNALSHGSDEEVVRSIREGLDLSADLGNGERPLSMAAWAGRESAIREIVRQGVHIDQRNTGGHTALARAAAADHVSVIKLLVTLGASVEIIQSNGCTALYSACKHGYPRTVGAFIQLGANVNHRGQNGATPLMDTVISESLAAALRAAASAANPNAVVDYAAVLSTLLDNGADPSLRTANGKTALDLAVELKNVRAANILRGRGGAGTPTPQQSGCYIATAVYGDYDAPAVITLRRFRDETLVHTAGGRAFVRVYYWLSPGLSKHFEQGTMASKWGKRALDALVQKLEPMLDSKLSRNLPGPRGDRTEKP